MSATVRLKIRGLKKYSFHPQSFLRNWFFMNEQQRYLIFFRKFTFCRHKFSCFEHVLRTMYKTVGFYLIMRMGAQFLLKEAIFEQFTELFKKLFGDGAEEKVIKDTALALEVNALGLFNIFLLRKCFYSFFLEFLAD